MGVCGGVSCGQPKETSFWQQHTLLFCIHIVHPRPMAESPSLQSRLFLFCLFVFPKEGAAAEQVRPTRVLLPRSALATATVALEICGATLSVRPVRPCLTFPLLFLDLSLHFNQVLSRPGPIPLLF